MPLPYYVSPEQMMQDKAEYAKKGIASLCIGGGMGVALTVER